MQFLSPEWRAALIEAAAATTDIPPGEADLSVGIEVHDGERAVSWRFCLSAGTIAVDDEPAPVVLVLDRATATELARGTLNAQHALTAGRLSIRGDARVLATHGDHLTRIGDVFASLRGRTEFPS